MLRLFFFVSLLGQISQAQMVDHPKGCVEEKSSPCAVWSVEKGRAHFKDAMVLSSPGSFYQFQGDSLYVAKGYVWVYSSKSVVLRSRYGQARMNQGSVWMEVNKENMKVKSFKAEVSVWPKGEASRSLSLYPGFEMSVGAMDYETGKREVSIPRAIDLREQIRVFGSTFPYELMNYKKTLAHLAKVIKEAFRVSRLWEQALVERKIASVKEAKALAKEEQVYRNRLDKYLRKLFKEKNNFLEP